MYSKYLDYTDAAIKSHQSAQGECEQKDVIISQLKGQIYELKQLETDFYKLNELIVGLEGKYSLLLSEKQRTEKEQKVKADLDKKSIIELRGQIDDLRVNLQKSNLQIEDLLRENTNFKRQCDGRATEIQTTRYQIKQMENKNERMNDENRSLAITVRGLKEQRKRLEEQCDELSNFLDGNIAKLKNVEKDVRAIESANARLQKTLYQAEKDNNKLVVDLKERNQDAKKAEQKLKGVHNGMKQLELSYKNIDQQSNKSKNQLDRLIATLNNELSKGKQLQGKIASVETSIRVQQNQLDAIISQQEKLRKQHFAALDKNKNLNNQIDKILSLIGEYQLVNRQLIDEIEIYIDQDEQAKSMLSRKDFMRDIIEGTVRKVALTEQPIRHLKC